VYDGLIILDWPYTMCKDLGIGGKAGVIEARVDYFPPRTVRGREKGREKRKEGPRPQRQKGDRIEKNSKTRKKESRGKQGVNV